MKTEFKICSACREWLPLTKFVRRSAKCHTCRAIQEKQRITPEATEDSGDE